MSAIQDMGAREYDPTTGRFLSADPAVAPSDPQSLNGYDYGDNNPIGKADPSGARPVDDTGGTTNAQDLKSWQHSEQQAESNASASTPVPATHDSGCNRGCGNDPVDPHDGDNEYRAILKFMVDQMNFRSTDCNYDGFVTNNKVKPS